MAARAKYKEGDKIKFTFAGSLHEGKITDVRKDGNKISYRAIDEKYTYPVLQEQVIEKL